MIKTIDIAWAAGFMEGEGTFDISNRISSRVTAAQVQREPLERLLALFGGRIVQRKTKGFSLKPIWVWSTKSRRSVEIMMTLYVLMSPKRKQEIERALKVWKNHKRILRPHGSDYCGRGHELTIANIYEYNGYRKCRLCRKINKKTLRKRRLVHVTQV